MGKPDKSSYLWFNVLAGFTLLLSAPSGFLNELLNFAQTADCCIFSLQLCGPCFSCSWYYLSEEPVLLQGHRPGSLPRGSLGRCPWLCDHTWYIRHCNLLFFVVKSTSLSGLLHSCLSLFSKPFYLSALYRIPCHGTFFSQPLPCLFPFLNIDLICLIPFALDAAEAFGKGVSLYQSLWFLLQRTACPQAQPDPHRCLFKLPNF